MVDLDALQDEVAEFLDEREDLVEKLREGRGIDRKSALRDVCAKFREDFVGVADKNILDILNKVCDHVFDQIELRKVRKNYNDWFKK